MGVVIMPVFAGTFGYSRHLPSNVVDVAIATRTGPMLSQNPPWADQRFGCHQPSRITAVETAARRENSVENCRSET